MQADLGRLSPLVQQLGDATSERFGQVDRSLQVHAEITQSLAGTANSLREALASSNARGQWGERMAEDVLRLAGMQEKVNYFKRTAVSGDGTGIPDFTFVLPKGHVLFMDVKFPMASYLRFLDAGTEAERSAHRATFVRDVRARVKELAKREYAAGRRSAGGRQRAAVRAQREPGGVHPRVRHRRWWRKRWRSTSSSARRSRCSPSSASSARRSTTS